MANLNSRQARPYILVSMILVAAGVMISIFGRHMQHTEKVSTRDYVSKVKLNDNTVVTLIERDFDPQLFKIQGCISQASSCVINSQETITEHQSLPKTYLASIVVHAFGRNYNLPVDNMYDPLTPGFIETAGGKRERNFGGHCYEAGWCTFRGVFGDGENVYAAQWEMFEGRVTRTVLTGDQEIYGWFASHLDPDYFE